jgi:Tol biopolymer transport system component
MALAAGTRFGLYEIVEPIGKGGMGEVYRATDTKLGRDVAIKILPSALAKEPDRLARFEREAKLLATLNHPHIASVHSLDEHEGTLYLAMELIEGETLEEKLKSGALPADDALRLALQIAEALEAAHDKGVVHRDLKPANIMVMPNGQAKVLDFGLAKAFSGDPNAATAAHSPALSVAMTQAGLILGTAGYMSPEQASGQATDQRADIWAFGVVLYEMLSGLPLFSGESVPHILADVLRMEPDWKRLPKDLHPRILQTLERCLEKKPRNRYHSIADVRVDIEKVLSDPQRTHVAAANTQPASKRVLPVAATAVVAAIVIGLGAWNLKPEASLGIVAAQRLSVLVPANRPIDMLGAPRLGLALSPDGTQLVYVGTAVDMPADGERSRLELRSLDTLVVRDLPGTAGARQPFFSPDGQWLAFFTGMGELKKISLAGGDPITLLEGINGSRWSFGVWSEDGSILFGTMGTGLRSISAEGGAATDLTTPDSTRGETGHSFPSLVPSNRALLFTNIKNEDLSSRIEAVMLDSGERRVVVENGRRPIVLSSGHLLFQRDDVTLVAPFDLEQLRLTGPAVPLVDTVQRDEEVAYIEGPQLAVSRNGTLAYLPAVDTSQSLVLVGLEGQVELLRSAPGVYELPRVSPDGRAVAYIENSEQIRIYDLQRGTTTRLGQGNSGSAEGAEWRPDGRALAVATRGATLNGISIWNLDGTYRLLVPIPPGVAVLRNLSWSPDGSQLAYTVQTGSQHDIWVLTMGEAPTTAPLIDSAASEYSPKFSPDGRWLAYQSDESGRLEIYVQRYPEGVRMPVSSDGGTGPVWSPDGRQLYFQGSDGSEPKLMAVSVTMAGDGLQLGEPVAQFDLRVPNSTGVLERYLRSINSGANYDVLPDGSRFVMLRGADEAGAREIVVVLNWFEELQRLVPVE